MVGFVDRVVMPLMARAGVQVIVPDLSKIRFHDADSLCKTLGISLVKTRTRPDERLIADSVIDQFPTAGSIVRPGRIIEVVVSSQAGLIACPSVLGRSVREAVITADSCGLKVKEGAVRYSYSVNEPEGVVIHQTPPPFTGVLRGAEIKLTVSLGSEPSVLTTPDLTGRNLEDARFLLAKYKLSVGEITRYPDWSTPPGTILNQSPTPGSEPSGAVSLTISSRPEGEEPIDTLTPAPVPQEIH